jgi:hypothetical protein
MKKINKKATEVYADEMLEVINQYRAENELASQLISLRQNIDRVLKLIDNK